MKRRNSLLIAFGTVVTAFVFVLFIVQGWAYVHWNEGKPLTTLEPEGKYAESIMALVNPVFIVAAVVFFAVLGIVLFIGIKFRDRGDIETADEIPHQLHGNSFLEIGWTILPAVVLMFVGIATVVTLTDLNAPAGENALRVKVEGQQWWWRYIYDTNEDGRFDELTDVVTANELVIPTGRDIALTQTSNDVIHSFWIPAINGKKDVVPGMQTEWKLNTDNVGTYWGQCTEFCGLSHANMRMVVRAVTPPDFTKWMLNQRLPGREPTTDVERAGKAIFTQQLCSNCHLIRGVNEEKVNGPLGVKKELVSGVAPDLTHFGTRGTFAGSVFNSHFPNPEGNIQPFGQTCKVRGERGELRPSEAQALPDCLEANDPDTLDVPWTSGPGNPDNPPNDVALAAWLRDPTKMKPMSPEPEQNPHAGGRRRGMPNLKLPEDQIDQLVAYLNSLK